MRASGVGPGRFITLLVAVSACLLSAAIATPAHAQFVCGGSGTGAEPQKDSGSNNVAIGNRAFINPTFNSSTAIGGQNLLNGSNTVLLGLGASTVGNATSDNSIALGSGAQVGGNNSTAVGQSATASAFGSTA